MNDLDRRDAIVSLAEHCESHLRLELDALDRQQFEDAAMYAEGAEWASHEAFVQSRFL